MIYTLRGYGRLHGAIGRRYFIYEEVIADSLEQAKVEFRKLYETNYIELS